LQEIGVWERNEKKDYSNGFIVEFCHAISCVMMICNDYVFSIWLLVEEFFVVMVCYYTY